MNDDFNILRSNDDEPESPDDGLDWLNSLDSDSPESGTDDDLPEVQADNPLGWLEAYAAPDEAEPDENMDWLQDDDPFALPSSRPQNADWTNKAGTFPSATDPTAPSSPTEDLPWLQESAPEAGSELSDTDLFAGLDEALGLGGTPAPQVASQSDVPDWLTEDTLEAVPTAEDMFAQFDSPASQAAHDDNPFPDDDVLGQLKLTDTGSSDWFVESDEQPAADAVPDWLQNLGDVEEEPEAPEPQAAIPADDDFLAEMFGEQEEKEAFGQQASDFDDIRRFDAPGLQDIDSLLASYDSAPDFQQTDHSSMTAADLDRLLSDSEVEEISARRTGDAREPIPGLSPDTPEWLAEIGASVGSVDEVSAAALVRKQTQNERSLDDLSDRLFALHEAGQQLPAPADSGSADVIRTLLPGINQVISAAPIKTGLPGITGDVALTSQQRDRINLLKTLVAVEEEKPRTRQPSAIDLTLDSDNMSDIAEPDLGEQPQEVEAAPVIVPRRRVRVKIDRLLISLVVTLAVVLPFVVGQLRIGDLPPAQFVAGSRQQAAYDRVNSLTRGQLALVTAEYGPTGAAELDSALDAVLRHIFIRGARPVIVSGNAVGLLHAQNVLAAITQDAAFMARIRTGNILVANQDYYVSRYLVGEAVGLRDFGQNMAGSLNADVNGQPMNLQVTSLHDFSAIILIAERGEDVRTWGEQIAPLAGQPLVIATGYSAAPLAEPYALSQGPGAIAGIGGMLVGYGDAYTYRQMVDAGGISGVKPANVPATPTTVESVQPTAESTESVAPFGGVPTGEAVTPDPDATTASAQTESTEVATVEATVGEGTPEPTLEPTSPGVVVQAVIKSDGAINVREGPGTTFPRVIGLDPGAVVQVIGRNGDGQWIQIRTEDGKEGWVSAALIEIQEPTLQPTVEPSPTREGAFQVDPNAVVGLISDVSLFVPALQETEEATPEVTPEVTLEPTIQPTAIPTVVPTAAVSALPDTFAYRDERWYGMTLGLMAIIVVIALGALVNIVRGLFRRGK